MRFKIVNGRLRPTKSTFDADEILRSAHALFRTEQSNDLRGLVADKIGELRDYDVPDMGRILAVCCWGRSGSLLLASYLDGHDDVLMLPEVCGQNVFRFFDRYPSLSLGEKLLAYPAYQQLYSPFFEGNFGISSTQYYASVQAIVEQYAESAPEFLVSRRAFLLFLHIAYNMALGRRPASRSPLIVYAQHRWDEKEATQLVEDFPRAKFVHTIRDPMSVFDRGFDHWFRAPAELPPREPFRDPKETRPPPWNSFSTVAPWNAFDCLINNDRPHVGMESRTRMVRFEDMHRDTAEVMRELSNWLGLSFQSTLLDSTFNGIPYVVARDGKAWTGRRPEQTQRSLKNVYLKDQALLFALFYENFDAWDYPCPRIYGNPVVRCAVFFPLLFLPTKMEVTVAKAVLRRRLLPSIKQGNISVATYSLLRIAFCRVGIMWLLVPDFFRRCANRKSLLQLGKRGGAPRRHDNHKAAGVPASLRY